MKIEIICKPCRKCELLQERIEYIIECLQFKFHAKAKHEIKINRDIRDAEKLGYNLTQVPIVIIDGYVEFVGHVKEEQVIRKKLEARLKGL